ncbi:class I SAM-dependent methyltransferase [Anaeromyxobacter sp. Fw109-5]|uniref:class I SAM-dependent methyltransferase n=1 Tax=Anaeromyxobacter sp. (strain Fw109-5) TaxID=404589 RepID=UPI0000ED6DD4|nr:methyltransferase domain-containing protein [Anaeromyxobacter sp. Fw109-5]ABS28107.1 Methyltransferase type 11 [Anaeromyxobacter sp. Fw109-5]
MKLQGSTTAFDEKRAERFAEGMAATLNSGALAVMISVGHRTGLFDTLAEHPGSPSAALARAAGLEERYVREWLGAMVAGRIVEFDAERRTYTLPAEHAAFLTRAAAPNNLAVYAQYIPVVASVEDDVLACFRAGGGVPYERYARFHEVMSEDSEQTILTVLFSDVLPLAEGLAARLEAGAALADLGCGRGRALLRMAERFPRSRFVGYDLSSAAVAWARGQAERLGLGNARFLQRDLRDFDRSAEPGAFDAVTTFDAVHDQPAPLALLCGIRRTLRDDGVYLMQDIQASSDVAENRDHPFGPFLYTVSTMHCLAVSLAQGGDGLGTMWGTDTARAMLAEAGFGSVEVHQLPHDPMNAYLVARP